MAEITNMRRRGRRRHRDRDRLACRGGQGSMSYWLILQTATPRHSSPRTSRADRALPNGARASPRPHSLRTRLLRGTSSKSNGSPSAHAKGHGGHLPKPSHTPHSSEAGSLPRFGKVRHRNSDSPPTNSEPFLRPASTAASSARHGSVSITLLPSDNDPPAEGRPLPPPPPHTQVSSSRINYTTKKPNDAKKKFNCDIDASPAMVAADAESGTVREVPGALGPCVRPVEGQPGCVAGPASYTRHGRASAWFTARIYGPAIKALILSLASGGGPAGPGPSHPHPQPTDAISMLP